MDWIPSSGGRRLVGVGVDALLSNPRAAWLINMVGTLLLPFSIVFTAIFLDYLRTASVIGTSERDGLMQLVMPVVVDTLARNAWAHVRIAVFNCRLEWCCGSPGCDGQRSTPASYPHIGAVFDGLNVHRSA